MRFKLRYSGNYTPNPSRFRILGDPVLLGNNVWEYEVEYLEGVSTFNDKWYNEN